MYPALRAGDVLRIRSCAASDVAVGDIAVCRTPDCLLGHRVIDKGVRDGRAFIVTRPDRSRRGSDVPTFDENLLGIVEGIERCGVPVTLEPYGYPWPGRCYHAVRLALLEATARFRSWLMEVIAHAEAHAPYRFLARTWFAMAHPRLTYVVHVPLNAVLGDAVYRRLSPDDFDPRMEWKGRVIDRWTLLLQVPGVREPGARVTFVRGAANAWRVEESEVRGRYRGVGLADALMREADKILARSG